MKYYLFVYDWKHDNLPKKSCINYGKHVFTIVPFVNGW